MTAKYADPAQIKWHREVALKTQAQAAAVVGVSARAWQSWELGARRMPAETLAQFDAACQAEPLSSAPSSKASTTPQAPAQKAPKPDWLTKPLVFTHEVHKLTPEQAQECAKDLATPYLYDPKEVKGALTQFHNENEERLTLAKQRHAELMARSDRILTED